MEKRVEIILGPDGSIKVEAKGFKGETCEEATAFLDRLFGDPESKDFKDSYYEAKSTTGIMTTGYCG